MVFARGLSALGGPVALPDDGLGCRVDPETGKVKKPDTAITAGKLPANAAFALPGRKGIPITEYEFGQSGAFDVTTGGLPLWIAPAASGGATAG